MVYDDVTGGALVLTLRNGAAMANHDHDENMTARLLSEAEVDELRGAPMPMSPSLPEDFDYRSALRASIDLIE